MRPLYIFDLDGTIALISHRRHLVMGDNPNWPAFNAACVRDTPNAAVVTTLKQLRQSGAEILIFSARNEEVRDLTVDWLVKHDIFRLDQLQDGVLTMRDSGDYTPDHVLKKRWLKNMLDVDRQRLVAVFDDRDAVVNVWRDEGIACFQVAPGDF